MEDPPEAAAAAASCGPPIGFTLHPVGVIVIAFNKRNAGLLFFADTAACPSLQLMDAKQASVKREQDEGFELAAPECEQYEKLVLAPVKREKDGVKFALAAPDPEQNMELVLAPPEPEEEMRRMQCLACEHARRVLDEHEKLMLQLEDNRDELELRSKQLDNLLVRDDVERRKIDSEKQKNALATSEQQKADENVLKLVEEQKKEKEAALKKRLQFEKQLDAKHKLELELQQLKGKLEVMKAPNQALVDVDKERMSNDELLEEQKKEKEAALKKRLQLEKQLDVKHKLELAIQQLNGKLEVMKALNQALVDKERMSNDELQEARKELTLGWNDLSRNGMIRTKRMGELSEKPFIIACKERFAKSEVDMKAAMFFSEWKEHLKDSGWHPFKVITTNEKPQEIINEDGEKLVALKEQLGDQVCEAVRTALLELNEYNASGKYDINELWNFREQRKATLKEAVEYILRHLKVNKRRRMC